MARQTTDLASILALAALALCTPPALGFGSASADDRCTGTLCDLWYRNSPAQSDDATPKPAAPTPVTVPSGNFFSNWFHRSASAPAQGQPGSATPPPATTVESDASANNSYMHLGGGGILNWGSKQRCSGTICDTIYGGPPPAQQNGVRPVTQQTGQIARRSEPVASTVALTEQQRRLIGSTGDVARPHCSGGDPWHCYRK